MKERIIVAGIGTGVGKTFVSALCVQALVADYWKPIQSGSAEGSDRDWVREHVSVETSLHPEAFSFSAPLSPHAAAALECREIEVQNIQSPAHVRPLVVESAGGLLVPLRPDVLQIDLFSGLKARVLLVVRHYLGSINHTLLSLEALRARRLPVAGMILIGEPLPGTVETLRHFGNTAIIAEIPWFDRITKETVVRCAVQNQESLREHLTT